MNNDISGNKEAFENTAGDNAKFMLISGGSIVVVALIVYFAYTWYNNRKQKTISNTGIVETTQPGIVSQFFTPGSTTNNIPSYTQSSSNSLMSGGKRKLKKNRIVSKDNNMWATILVIGGIHD